MSGIYGILGMGSRALLINQKAMDITGHNIANVNTPGFSRQRVNLSTNDPVSFFQPGQMGTGVKALEIQRIYDRFLGAQINNENQSLGRWDAQKSTFEKVEMIIDETSGYGLSQAMNEFWNAWQDLVDNPSGQAERVSLLNKSENMADRFQKFYGDIQQVREDINNSISGTTEEINLIAGQIADLNQQVSVIEAGGQNANDYRDQRDLLLKELSSKIDINSFEGDDGMVTVIVGGGNPLVQDSSSWSLSVAPDTGPDNQDMVVWEDGYGNVTDITANISGGKLKGWIQARDVEIPDYLDRLDTLAQGIMEQVNVIHRAGFDLNGGTNRDFFTGGSAFDMAVNSDIVDNVNLIAAAGNPGGLPGDNENAIAIAGLQYGLLMSGGMVTFDDYYNSLVSDVGSDVQKASINFEHQTSMTTHIENYRESISGVSIDEEMVNLIKFQHAYDAAAKLISTADEMLSTLINMI